MYCKIENDWIHMIIKISHWLSDFAMELLRREISSILKDNSDWNPQNDLQVSWYGNLLWFRSFSIEFSWMNIKIRKSCDFCLVDLYPSFPLNFECLFYSHYKPCFGKQQWNEWYFVVVPCRLPWSKDHWTKLWVHNFKLFNFMYWCYSWSVIINQRSLSPSYLSSFLIQASFSNS